MTAKPKTERIDHKDLAVQCEQILDNDGNVLALVTEQDAVTDLAVTDSAAALSTSDTYSDAAVNTAIDAAVDAAAGEIETKVNAILAALRAGGILAE